MILEEMTALYDPWYGYQQPAHPASGLNAAFRTLLGAIDQGWEVVDLVQVFSNGPGMAKSFAFTLVQETSGRTCQLTVMATPALEQFIGHNGYEKRNNKPPSQ